MSDNITTKEEPGFNNNDAGSINNGGSLNEDIKPEVSDQINVKVQNQQNQEMFFKIKKTTKLGKLMDTYCARLGLKKENVRFKYDGEGISENATPLDIKLEDGDVIDVFLAQTGGASF